MPATKTALVSDVSDLLKRIGTRRQQLGVSCAGPVDIYHGPGNAKYQLNGNNELVYVRTGQAITTLAMLRCDDLATIKEELYRHLSHISQGAPWATARS